MYNLMQYVVAEGADYRFGLHSLQSLGPLQRNCNYHGSPDMIDCTFGGELQRECLSQLDMDPACQIVDIIFKEQYVEYLCWCSNIMTCLQLL